MTQRNGWYYLSFTTGNSVEIWSSRRMTDWTQARKKLSGVNLIAGHVE
jgi:hypothetical protein